MSRYENAVKFTYIFNFSLGTFIVLSVLRKKESCSSGTGGTPRNRLRLGIWCSNLVLSEIKPLINILQVYTAEPVTGSLLPAVSFQRKKQM